MKTKKMLNEDLNPMSTPINAPMDPLTAYSPSYGLGSDNTTSGFMGNVRIAGAARNGSAPPEWVLLAPRGSSYHQSAGVDMVLDDDCIADVLANFENDDQEVLVDYEHASEREGQPTEAAGWIVGLDSDESGLWAQIKWSDTGAQAVLGRRFAYISPVFDSMAEDGEAKPYKLISAALTNTPAVESSPPILGNRSMSWETDSDVDYRAELCCALGLPVDAPDAQIEQELERRKTGQKQPSLAERVRKRPSIVNRDVIRGFQPFQRHGHDKFFNRSANDCAQCGGDGVCKACSGRAKINGQECAACKGTGDCCQCSGKGTAEIRDAFDANAFAYLEQKRAKELSRNSHPNDILKMASNPRLSLSLREFLKDEAEDKRKRMKAAGAF